MSEKANSYPDVIEEALRSIVPSLTDEQVAALSAYVATVQEQAIGAVEQSTEGRFTLLVAAALALVARVDEPGRTVRSITGEHVAALRVALEEAKS